MDVETIDASYRQLESQSQLTVQALTTLAQKLQAAAQAGDPNAREWMLDLKEIALGIQAEQNQMTTLLQSIHGFVANQVAPLTQPPQYQQAQYQQPQYQQPPAQQQPQYAPFQQPKYAPFQQPPPYQQVPNQQPVYQGQSGAGGMLQRFLGGGLGQAVVAGAGFGIGDDLINHLFR